MIDDQVRRHEWIHARGIAAQVGHGVAHRREVHDRGHAGEVLEQDPRRHERDLGLGRGAGSPGREGLDVRRLDQAAAGIPEGVLEEDPERDRGAVEVDSIAEGSEPPVVGGPRQVGAGTEWIWPWHVANRVLVDSTRGIYSGTR